MPGYTRRQLRRDILKEMIQRECACQDQDEMRSAHGVKFHHNGPEAESGMIRSNLYTLSQQAREMHDMIGMNDDLDEWVQEKIAVASSMLDSVYDYIGYEYKSLRGDVGSHDSYNPDVSDAMHDDEIYADYDYIDEDFEDDDDDFEEFVMNEAQHGLSEEEIDDMDADEILRDPWQPMRQSTGIMFFEDETNESRRLRRSR